MIDRPTVLTVEEAAAELRIGRSAAYEAIKRGEIPAVKIGRSLRVPRHRLAAMLDPENDNGPAGGGAEVKAGAGTPDGPAV
jgi:excisionase family DNA binding protein